MLTLQISLSAIARDSVEGKLHKLKIHARHHSLITVGVMMLTPWIPICLTLLSCLTAAQEKIITAYWASDSPVPDDYPEKFAVIHESENTFHQQHTHKHRLTHACAYGNTQKNKQKFESWTGPRKLNGHWRTSFALVSRQQGWSSLDVMRRDKTEEQTHDLQTTRTQQGSEIEIDRMPNTALFPQRTPVNILSHLLALEPHGTVTKKDIIYALRKSIQ